MATNTGKEMTSLLSRFGIDYKNAPKPTPAMLAFMRGLGMTLDTAADTKERDSSRIKRRTTMTLSDIAERSGLEFETLKSAAEKLASGGLLIADEEDK